MSTGPFSFRPFTTGVAPIKSRVFVSYHHSNDQPWYDLFATTFSDFYDVFTDTSLERRVDSDDTDYTRRAIREQNIKGSSMTIVLCGADTWKRRWVDWEIQMTLNKEHSLLGIALPTCAKNVAGQFVVPDRLHDNIRTDYAEWTFWLQTVDALKTAIANAHTRARWTRNIVNDRPSMEKSRP